MRIVEFDLGFEPHDKLNPALWQGEDLLPDVKSALVKIAEDFKKYIDIPFDVEDLVITGGQVSYYYTKHSDLDLHLIADFGSVQCDREAAELFDSKRLLYKEQYDINIYNIPVELYVENVDHPAVSSSYSIVKDQWIRAPEKTMTKIDQPELERMVKVWHTIIQQAIKTGDRPSLQNVLKLLRSYRKLGLKHQGEFGTPNLVYKSLRNDNSLAALTKLLDRIHNQQLSIGQ
jgi:hypothetical protein